MSLDDLCEACRRAPVRAVAIDDDPEQPYREQDRPLSHVALSALQACHRYDTAQLKKRRPVLEGAAPVEEMSAVLDAYLQRDPVPNVRRRVHLLQELLRTGPIDAW
jgi:hypothetical protein